MRLPYVHFLDGLLKMTIRLCLLIKSICRRLQSVRLSFWTVRTLKGFLMRLPCQQYKVNGIKRYWKYYFPQAFVYRNSAGLTVRRLIWTGVNSESWERAGEAE